MHIIKYILLFSFTLIMLISKNTYSKTYYYKALTLTDNVVSVDTISLDTMGNELSELSIIKSINFCPEDSSWFCTNGLSGIAFPKKYNSDVKNWSFLGMNFELMQFGSKKKNYLSPVNISFLFPNNEVYFVKEISFGKSSDYRILILSEREGLLGYILFEKFPCNEDGDIYCSSNLLYLVDGGKGVGGIEFESKIKTNLRNEGLYKEINW